MGQDFGPKSTVLDNQKTAALIDDNSGDLQNIRCIRLMSVLKGGVEPPRPFGHTDLNRARLPIPPLERALSAAYSILAVERLSKSKRCEADDAPAPHPPPITAGICGGVEHSARVEPSRRRSAMFTMRVRDASRRETPVS